GAPGRNGGGPMKMWHILSFAMLYLWEVVRSTGYLAWLVVRPRIELRSRFVEVPLELESEFGRFFFACLVTMTPGTLAVSLDGDRGVLLVHLLDAPDEVRAVADIKARIEVPLLRIFT